MLDARLQAVARAISAVTHADIGCDHGYLARFLLEEGRVERIIAIEKHQGPYQLACRSLAGLNAEVRLADGLAGLSCGEADSLSLSGLGGLNIRKILSAYPERLPPDLVVQANDAVGPEILRRWAYHQGFHLKAEWLVPGRYRHQVLAFQRSTGQDPAYGCEIELEWAFGPQLLRRGEALCLIEADLQRLRTHWHPSREPESKRLLQAQAYCLALSRSRISASNTS